MNARRSQEICIVGGGVAGTILALELANAGRGVLLLEAGADRPVGDWREGTWIDPEFDVLETDTDHPFNTRLCRIRALGGSGEAWEGYTYRLREDEFTMCSRWGMGYDWPVTLAQMLPYYRQAEALLGVSGNHAEFGRPKDDAAPLPPFAFEEFETTIIQAARSLGWNFVHVPQARNTLGYGRRRACLNIGECNACPIGARWSPRAALRQALMRHPGIRVMTDTLCTELLAGTDGRCTGLKIFHKPKGQISILEAETVVVSGGAIDSIRLFLSSPELLKAMDSQAVDSVGRGFMDHPIDRISVSTSWRRDTLKRQTNILASCHDFRTFDRETDSPGFVVNLNSRVPAPGVLLSAHMEMLPHPENRITLGDGTDPSGMRLPLIRLHASRGIAEGTLSRARDAVRLLSRAVGTELEEHPLQLWACHHMGGLRMGMDDAAVVDPELTVRTSPNVFVSSLAVMPTSSSVNPTLTLVALTIRLADHLLERTPQFQANPQVREC